MFDAKIIFCGTPEFADIILQNILKAKFDIAAVVTQPDRPKGRKQILTSSPVKLTAEKYGLPILQPEKLKDEKFQNQLRDFRADLMIVAAYGKIIPQAVLDIPSSGSINVHPSLLPKLRGASPVAGAILAGERQTGVTLILMDALMDHGPILSQQVLSVAESDTTETLQRKLAHLAGTMLIETVPAWLEKRLTPLPQDESKATYTKILSKTDGRIDWTKSAEEIEKQIRAYSPWPTSWTTTLSCSRPDFENKKLIILEASVYLVERAGSETKNLPPGAVTITENKIWVGTKSNQLEILKLQLEGAKPMTAAEFVRGHSQINGCVLG